MGRVLFYLKITKMVSVNLEIEIKQEGNGILLLCNYIHSIYSENHLFFYYI